MELFPPGVAHVMLVLVGVLSMVSLVGIAYLWSILISRRKQIRKIDELEKSITGMQQEIKELKGRLVADQLKDAVPLKEAGQLKELTDVLAKENAVQTTKAPREVWQDFIDDYNSLAASMHVPKAEQACQAFAEGYRLDLLICMNPAAQENGQTVPKFTAVKNLSESTYWAWAVKEAPGAYVVVPNPLNPYDQKLHTEAGMKETFASNYEQGTAESIQVRLPAKFQNQGGTWKIIQPGVIRIK